MENRINGIHHITAIAGDAKRNYDFYTGVGLRFKIYPFLRYLFL